MAQCLLFDPVKKDYIIQNGSPIETDRVLEPSYYALAIPRDQWLHAVPNQGSYLYTLANQKRTGSIEQEFFGYARDAIQNQVVANNLAKSVALRNLTTSRTGTSNEIDVTPNQTSVSNQLNFTPV